MPADNIEPALPFYHTLLTADVNNNNRSERLLGVMEHSTCDRQLPEKADYVNKMRARIREARSNSSSTDEATALE